MSLLLKYGTISQYLSVILLKKPKPILNISNFEFKKADSTYENKFHNIYRDEIQVLFDKKTMKDIGYISWKQKTGQIGLIYLEEEYRGYGLGKQMLDFAALNLYVSGNVDNIFAVSSTNHPFWANNKNFIRKTPAGAGVSADGYAANLNNYDYGINRN